jgi:membrane protease YdiL (CAAX protease family)
MLPIVMTAAILATELIARATLGNSPTRPAWLLAAGTGLIHVLTFALLIPLLDAHRFDWKDAFGLFRRGWIRNSLTAAALTLPALAVAWLLHQGSGWALDQFSVPHDQQAAVEAVRGADRWWERLMLFTFAAVTAPMAEEVVFRGILWPVARERGWSWRGALLIALAFAVIHANAAAFVPLTFLGLFWTWLYERSGDLSAPILSHGLFNAINFLSIVAAGPAASSPSP